MSRVIVGPLQPTDMQVDVEQLLGELRAVWPHADIQRAEGGELVLFRCSVDSPDLYCALGPTRQALFVEYGSLEAAAQAVLLFRKLVPSNYELFICDSGLNFQQELRSDTPRERIVEALS
jgi:hypothetical protein